MKHAEKDVVLIPTYNRPEFLQWTLDYIKKARGCRQMLYMFAVEWGADDKTMEIIKKFPLSKIVVRPQAVPNKKMRLSYNILNGMREAAHCAKRFVFVIEDDIFISDDFFEWHYGVHLDEDRKLPLFCTISSRNENTRFKTGRRADAYYYAAPTDYHCRGVCFDKNVIIQHILPHMCNGYWENPRAYVKSIGSWLNEGYCEQAGLIRRIRKMSGLDIAYPHVPRCFHAGFYGKNRGSKQPGSFADKLRRVNETAHSLEKRKKASDRLSDADKPCSLKIKPWKKQTLVPAEPETSQKGTA